jgi:2-dehydro-3-deoxygluconokinase
MSVVGLGEALVRLSTPGRERLEQARALTVDIGGAELNALIGIAASGREATWLTRLPDNPLGRRIAAHAAAHGVKAVVDWDASARAALYFVEHGAAPRPTEVLYDRAASAMTALTPSSFDWPAALHGASVALCSGITCALGDGAAAAVRALFDAARAAGARTVFDVNHRNRMWTWDQSLPVLRDVVAGVDVLFAGSHDLRRLLGRAEEDAEALARRALDRFGATVIVLRESARPEPGRVAVTVRAVTAEDEYESAPVMAEVVDAFGAGDAALAAFLSCTLDGAGLADAVERTAWACAFQHTISGDAWSARAADVELASTADGRILR